MSLRNKNSMYSFEQALGMRFKLSPDKTKGILSAAYIHENDFPIDMHSHAFYEINIVIKGSGTHFIENNSFPAQEGDVFVIPPNIEHGYSEKATNTLKIFHILLSDEFMARYINLLKEITGYSLLFNTEPLLRKNNNIKLFANIGKNEFIYYTREFKRLLSFNEDLSSCKNETDKTIKTLNLILDLANTLTADETIKNSASQYVNDIINVITYLDKNYAEKIEIDNLCKIANMSRSSLLNRFSAVCKCSPAAYLMNVRIEHACTMLKTCSNSIAMVAQDCGFYDSSHFSKNFLKLKGLLPKDYRAQSEVR